MKYYKVTFNIEPFCEDFADILSALLCDTGFEAFETKETCVEAYIQQSFWNEEETAATVREFPVPDVCITFSAEEAEYENWNQQWEEEGFKPIIIDDLIAVHSNRHTDIPEVRYDITITPRQAFGTGSHQTTRMILTQLAEMQLEGARVVDAGTGTGILAIMCVKRGAESVFAYDIDEWSVSNTKDNLLLNGITDDRVKVVEGDSAVLSGTEGIDLLIANINRNILLSDMEAFHRTLSANGRLLLSGFYIEDIPHLTQKAAELGMKLTGKKNDGEWAMLLFETDAAGRMDV